MIKPTMNLEKLRAEYQKMNVRFKDDFELKRALIYYGAVTDASQFFVADTAKQALDKTPGGYEKVKSALSSSQLLTGLCHLLDEPTIEIVNAELAQRKPYGTYFEELFKGYPNSIDTFLGKYSNLKKIFALIKQHFQDNILLACTRVLSDWPALEAMFLEEKGQKLEELTEITSTGSDFHKGGQQVLILTFRTNFVNKPLRIVYKPSDLEVDCLIMGKTEALTKAGLADFQTESLMEILWLMKPPADVPPDDFPRYKICREILVHSYNAMTRVVSPYALRMAISSFWIMMTHRGGSPRRTKIRCARVSLRYLANWLRSRALFR